MNLVAFGAILVYMTLLTIFSVASLPCFIEFVKYLSKIYTLGINDELLVKVTDFIEFN